MVTRSTLLLLSVLASACGGLDNRPLTTGVAIGHASECDSEGFAGVVGNAAVRVALDGSCGFRVEALAPGPYQLFVAPTAKKAVLAAVEVKATQVSDVGSLVAQPGAFARVRVSAPGTADYEGTVTAVDLPLSSTPIGKSGMSRIGPFPAGCYRLEVAVSGVGHKSVSSCLSEGTDTDVLVEL